MLGFNWVDLIVALLLVLAAVEGSRVGLLSEMFVIAAFFAVLFLSGWLFPHIIRLHDATLRTAINALAVLLTSIYAALRGFDVGQKVHWSFRLGRLQKNRGLETAETLLGGVPGLAAGLILVWLLGVMITRLPFVGLSNSVSDARIMQGLINVLPPVPAVFADFNSHIDPNAQPSVFIQPKPQPTFDYDASAVQSAAARATPSMVRITSFSCGGIAAGSGFVVAPDLVATNAHVIAGSRRPIVKYGGVSYAGVPIYFDADLDLAILRVLGLGVPPLKLAASNVAPNTTVAILGYPGGNYRIEPGIIRDTRAIAGTSIYNQGSFGRGIYVVQGQAGYGNSGGPIVTQNGQAAGIIFSRSTEVGDIVYALTSVHINDALRQVRQSNVRVGTGACVAA